MPSTVQRGNYYKRKTKQWFQDHGYTVDLTEFACGMVINGKVIYRKIDIFGSDGIAMNGTDIIFWNSKHVTNPDTSTFSSEKSRGLAEFAKYPFPPSVKKWVVIWTPRKKDPAIFEV